MSYYRYGLIVVLSSFVCASSFFGEEQIVVVSPIRFGLELGLNVSNLGWAVDVSDGINEEKLYAMHSRVTNHQYQKEPGDGAQFNASARFFGRARLSEESYALLFVGLDTRLEDAATFRPSGEPSGQFGSTIPDQTVLDATIKTESEHLFGLGYHVGGFAMFQGLGLGFMYDLKEYRVEDHHANFPKLNRFGISDELYLFGFRVETEEIDADLFSVHYALEYMTNLGAASGDDMLEYYKDMTKRIGEEDDNGNGSLSVGSVHTIYHKASFAVSMNLI